MHLGELRNGIMSLIARVNIDTLRCYNKLSGRLDVNAKSVHFECQVDSVIKKRLETKYLLTEHDIGVNCRVALAEPGACLPHAYMCMQHILLPNCYVYHN